MNRVLAGIAQIRRGLLESIWRPDSDWDLLVMGDVTTLNELRTATDLRCPEVDLLIVYNGDDFEEPWPDPSDSRGPKRGSLGALPGWEWNYVSDREAQYTGRGASHEAIRVWP
jgi:hypothetical protein